jgi:hypothetical protein
MCFAPMYVVDKIEVNPAGAPRLADRRLDAGKPARKIRC